MGSKDCVYPLPKHPFLKRKNQGKHDDQQQQTEKQADSQIEDISDIADSWRADEESRISYGASHGYTGTWRYALHIPGHP